MGWQLLLCSCVATSFSLLICFKRGRGAACSLFWDVLLIVLTGLTLLHTGKTALPSSRGSVWGKTHSKPLQAKEGRSVARVTACATECPVPEWAQALRVGREERTRSSFDCSREKECLQLETWELGCCPQLTP